MASPCPASSVTTATSLTSPLTPSHGPRGPRICCPVHTHSSPSWTSARGKNQTQVRKRRGPREVRSACCVLTWLTFLPDPSCGPIPRIQSGYWLLCDSVVLYQCHSGFKLLGSPSVSCDPNSQQWSSAPPTCQGTTPKPGPGDVTVSLQSRASLYGPSCLIMSHVCVADINECEEQTSLCPPNRECLNIPGSFTCSGWFCTAGVFSTAFYAHCIQT